MESIDLNIIEVPFSYSASLEQTYAVFCLVRSVDLMLKKSYSIRTKLKNSVLCNKKILIFILFNSLWKYLILTLINSWILTINHIFQKLLSISLSKQRNDSNDEPVTSKLILLGLAHVYHIRAIHTENGNDNCSFVWSAGLSVLSMLSML